MFREMRRGRQALPKEMCEAVLSRGSHGVLALAGDEGYPYGVPLDFWYNPQDGCLYFHCAPEGHKIDAMDRCDKVSFCVCSQGEPIEGDWALKFRSVIVFGRLSRVEDPQNVRQALTALAGKVTDDQAYTQKEIQTYAHRVQCPVLRPEQITGKQIRES